MFNFMIYFLLGMCCCGAVVGLQLYRLKSVMNRMVPVGQVEAAERKLRQAIEKMQERFEQHQQLLELEQNESQDHLVRLQADHSQLMQRIAGQNSNAKSTALQHCDLSSRTIDELLGLVKTFERWHGDMNLLIAHNRDMHRKNDEFAQIVRQMVIVALNASIEAARVGHQGSGFAVVASEVRNLANRAQSLSEDYRNNLYQNDLITTTTFQDLQAGGKMITAAIIGLDQVNKRTKDALCA